MKKVPMMLIIDDGIPITDVFPMSYLHEFCDLMQRYGVHGKFSVIPMPTGHGDIVKGIEGHDKALTDQWLDTVRSRLGGSFDFCPEILTHAQVVDLETGGLLPVLEHEWSRTQDRTTMAPYIARAVELLTQADLKPTGVTSPVDFGIRVENEYAASVALAFDKALGQKESWYFLHCRGYGYHPRPWVAYDDGERRVVSIPSNCPDRFWQSLDNPDDSDAFVHKMADQLLTEDGTAGDIAEILADNGWPVMLAHWQSMFSGGRMAGFKALKIVLERIERLLGDRVEWHSASELMRKTLAAASQRTCHPEE